MSYCLSTACLVPMAAAQTTQPADRLREAGLDFDSMLKKASVRPRAEMALRTRDGSALTEDQAKAIQDSLALFVAAEKHREDHDFAAAAEKAAAAFEARQRILGPNHFLAASARSLANTMQAWGALGEADREKIAEADGKLRQAADHYTEGDYSLAARDAGEALAFFESHGAKNDAPVVAALFELGRAQIELSQLDAADAALARARDLAERAYGQQHPQIAQILDRIGWLRFHQFRRRTADARTLLEQGDAALTRSMEILLNTVGETAEFAEALDNLGTLLLYERRLAQALDAKFRALVVRKQLLGPDHKEVGISLSNIALVYETQGALDTAVDNRRKAAKILESALGPDHPYSLLEKSNLARLLLDVGQTEAAIPLLDGLAKVYELQSGQATSDVLARATHLCGAYLAAGKADKALELLDKALGQAKALYAQGQTQPAHLSLIDLFRTAYRYRLLRPARDVVSQVIAWDEAAGKSSGQDTVERILRAAQLGELHFHLRQFDEARRLFEQAISRTEALKGGRAVELFEPLMYLSELLKANGDFEGAERACDRALQLAESHWGRQSSGTAMATLQLAAVYTQQDHYDMAEILLDDAAATCEQLGQQEAAVQIRLLRERARLLTARGRNDEALARLKEALALAEASEKPGRDPNAVAGKGEILRDLIETSDPNDDRLRKDRRSWRSELKTLLLQLKAAHAITVEEEGWLKELGGDEK